jgi:hypothetical protein
MQNGRFPAGAAIAGAALIAANTPIAIRADKDHRIVSSLLKGFDRCRKLQAERSAWLASIHVRAPTALSPFGDCFKGNPGCAAIFPSTRGRNRLWVAGVSQPSIMQDGQRLERVFAT